MWSARRAIWGASVLALVLLSGSVRAQDVAVVQSKTVKIKLDNPKVRVLEATLPPGEKEAMHSHPPYVIYIVSGGKVRNHSVDGKTSDAEFKTGQVIYRDPLTHYAENIGTTTIRMILVELKEK